MTCWNTRRRFQCNICPVWSPSQCPPGRQGLISALTLRLLVVDISITPASSLPPNRAGVYAPAPRQQQEFLNYPINVEKNIEFGNLNLVVTCLDRLKSSNNVSILQQNTQPSQCSPWYLSKFFSLRLPDWVSWASLQYFYPKTVWSKLLACFTSLDYIWK